MFKDNLKKIRHEKKLSQKAVAEYLGVTQQSIAKWESGQSTPAPDALAELALLFTVSLDELVLTEEQRAELFSKLAPSSSTSDAPVQPAEETDFMLFSIADDSMAPEMFKDDSVIISIADQPASGEFALVSIGDAPPTVRKVIFRNGGYLLQPLNPSVSAAYVPKSSADRVKLWGRVNEIHRKW